MRGLARLISSAISKLGEDRAADETEGARAADALSSITSEPVMSVGIRSGVNWMRLVSSPSTMPSVSTSLVLARPGTPIRRPWPPASRVTSVCSITSSWPKITAFRPSRTRRNVSAAALQAPGRVALVQYVDFVHARPLGLGLCLVTVMLHRGVQSGATPEMSLKSSRQPQQLWRHDGRRNLPVRRRGWNHASFWSIYAPACRNRRPTRCRAMTITISLHPGQRVFPR